MIVYQSPTIKTGKKFTLLVSIWVIVRHLAFFICSLHMAEFVIKNFAHISLLCKQKMKVLKVLNAHFSEEVCKASIILKS